MTRNISDIILRLARQQLSADEVTATEPPAEALDLAGGSTGANAPDDHLRPDLQSEMQNLKSTEQLFSSLPPRGGGLVWGGERLRASHPHPDPPASRGRELHDHPERNTSQSVSDAGSDSSQFRNPAEFLMLTGAATRPDWRGPASDPVQSTSPAPPCPPLRRGGANDWTATGFESGSVQTASLDQLPTLRRGEDDISPDVRGHAQPL